MKRLANDFIGEALEIGKTAAKQIKPAKKVRTNSEQAKSSFQNSAPPGLEDLKGKKPTLAQMQKMRQDDNWQRNKGINSARIALKREMIRRYEKMQQEILKQEKEREQERLRKKQEEIEEAKKEQEKKQNREKEPVQPKRTKRKGFLGIFQRQKKGSKELGKVRAG